MPQAPHLTLLFDPLCGWCYAAQPALAAVAMHARWQLLPTGLFAQPQPMSTERAAYFWANDQRIAELTGQPFSEGYRSQVLADVSTPFDSRHATLAWHLIAQARPDEALAALHRLQALRYVDGLQHTAAHCADVAAEFGLDRAAFLHDFAQGWPEALHAQVAEAQALMRRHRLRGVPAALAGDTPIPGEVLLHPRSLISYLHQA